MLNTLRRIIQEVNAAPDLDSALDIIVRRVKKAINADVCSVFLVDETQNQHVLMASQGLRPESVGQVRISFGVGLVSLVVSRAELINIDDAQKHPNFHYFPETDEEKYHGFLGVPIIHHRKVLGVIAAQQVESEMFSEDIENFLITVAAQLAGAMAHAEISGEIEKLLSQRGEAGSSRPIQGLPGAPGVAIGTAVAIYPIADLDAIPDRDVEGDDIEAEIKHFNNALASVKKDITRLSKRIQNVLPQEEHALFDAYLLMLESHSLRGETAAHIMGGNWAPAALKHTINKQMSIFSEMDDPYLRERAEDIRELAHRILHYLLVDVQRKVEYPRDTVLVGDEITAAQLAEVPSEKLIGVVCAKGSGTSHVAILARALGIPAVMGAIDLPIGRIDGQLIVADGYSGNIIISPSEDVRSEYLRLAKEEEELTAELISLKTNKATTEDGYTIPLYANTGLAADITPALSSDAEGIGLYRTEFPFMIRQRFPGEDEQMRIYRQALMAFTPKPVVLRTLDVGGDKALPYFPIEEDNPFLGWRGIRITLDHPELFIVQVRAMLRAAIGLTNMSILLPMISQTTELDDARSLIDQAYRELKEEQFDVPKPRIGAMIEVPSAVYQAKQLAERVDFLSIGTNDLTQYLLAVDRNNARVADLYDALHPAVIEAINYTIEAAHSVNTPVSVCGEMAGDPCGAMLLVGMGVDSLSMSASSLIRIKWVINNLSMERAKQYLSDVRLLDTAVSIREYLNDKFERAGMGGLVRAGR